MPCRTFTSVCWLAVLILFLWPRSLPAQETIRVGLSSISATNGSVWVAEEKGLFKKYGVDTEVIIFGGGAGGGSMNGVMEYWSNGPDSPPNTPTHDAR